MKKKSSEGYKAVNSVDELVSSFSSPVEGTSIKKKTEAELKKDIASTRRPIGKSTLIYRRIRLNTDLAIIALIVAFAAAAGFSIKDFQWDRLVDYIKTAISLVFTVAAIIWKVHTPPGMVARNAIKRGQKSEGEVDEWGRSIMIKR